MDEIEAVIREEEEQQTQFVRIEKAVGTDLPAVHVLHSLTIKPPHSQSLRGGFLF